MMADEIRQRWKDAEMQDSHSVEVYKTFFLAEIGAQLAELNEKLTPASMVASIREIQQTIDQLDPA